MPENETTPISLASGKACVETRDCQRLQSCAIVFRMLLQWWWWKQTLRLFCSPLL